MTTVRSTRHILRAAIAIAAAGALACTGSDAPKVPLAGSTPADTSRAMSSAHAQLGPAAKAQLDTGNTLYRKKDYAGALARYRSAAELAPQHAAPLFGEYMVARATHDSVMADSALAGIRLRNGPLPTAPHSLKDSALQRMHDVIRKGASTS